MARAYSDDLRRKLLDAHAAGRGTLRELAERFGVSLAWAWKISAQRKHSGQMERVQPRRRQSRITPEQHAALRGWVEEQSDLTLQELRQRWGQQWSASISVGHLWNQLRKLDLRRKKSRSTPRNGTQKRTASAAARSRKNPSGRAGAVDFSG